MGSTCSGQTIPHQVADLPPILPQSLTSPQNYNKLNNLSMRFGDIQKIRASTALTNNNYKFILPIRDSQQFIKIQCPIISSYADQFSSAIKIKILSKGIKYQEESAPIIDGLDIDSDRQIYFRYGVRNSNSSGNGVQDNDKNSKKGNKTNDKQKEQISSYVMIKVYNYKNYHDPIFKNGLYQASIYKSMNSFINSGEQYLKDFFLIEKGTLNSMVFIHNPYLCSLADILAYRKSSQLPYSTTQQLYVASQILKSYKKLKINNIIHRDIRPSKILLYDCSLINIDDKNKDKKQKKRTTYYNESKKQLSYSLCNMQSARKFTKTQLREFNSNSKSDSGINNNGNKQKDSYQQQMLMTIRGVPIYCSGEVIKNVKAQSQIAVYHYNINQRVQLSKTLISLITLNSIPQQQVTSQQFLKKLHKKNKHLTQIIKLLLNINNNNYSIENISDKLQKMVNYSKLHLVPIAKNVNNNNTIVYDDYQVAMSYLPYLLRKGYRQRIQSSSTECMLSLHRQSEFLNKFQKILQTNSQNNKQHDNIAILDRLGKYYQGIGIKQNDYYKQQILLLLEICKKQRIYGYPTNWYLKKIQQLVNNKVSGMFVMKGNQGYKIRVTILMEEAYKQLFGEMKRQSDRGNKDNLVKAQELINQAMLIGSKIPNFQLQNQLDLIQAKTQIQLQVNGPDCAEQYAQKGLQLSNARQNFMTQTTMLDYKATFQYLLAACYLSKCREYHRKQQMSEQFRRNIKKAELWLTAARNIKIQLPQKNCMELCGILEGFGQLYKLKQSYQQSVKYYERVYRLYIINGNESIQNTQNNNNYTNNTEYDHKNNNHIHNNLVSDTKIVAILQTIYKIYQNNIEDITEQNKIQQKLKKYRKRMKKQQRDPMKNFQKIRYLTKMRNSSNTNISTSNKYNNKQSNYRSPNNQTIHEIQQQNQQDYNSYNDGSKKKSYHELQNQQYNQSSEIDHYNDNSDMMKMSQNKRRQPSLGSIPSMKSIDNNNSNGPKHSQGNIFGN